MKGLFSLLLTTVLVAVVCQGHRVQFSRHANQTGNDDVDVQITDWVLAAHGSTRMRANAKGRDWTTKFNKVNFHYPTFSVPFGEGPVLPAGVNHRTSDNHIHIPILGATSYPGSTEWPAGGANRKWSPPMVWEIDGNTGETVRIYDLSEYSACFNSVLRYTNDGYPFIALYAGKTGKGSTPIALLDSESDKVLDVYGDDSTEPMLLQITNTEPQQIIWAAIDANAGVNVVGHDIDQDTFVRTADTSTIIFGADGQTIYNNGFYNHNTGIFKFALPIAPHLRQDYFISGCNTRPWVMASDTKGTAFAVCGNLNSYDNSGKQRWSVNGQYSTFIALTDAEDVLFIGNGQFIAGLNVDNGEQMWRLAASDFGGSIPVSAQPWAPRYPIPLPNGNIAVLVVDQGVHSIAVVDSRSGKILKDRGVTFDFAPNMLTADNSNNVYAFGNEDGYLKVQRKSLGGRPFEGL